MQSLGARDVNLYFEGSKHCLENKFWKKIKKAILTESVSVVADNRPSFNKILMFVKYRYIKLVSNEIFCQTKIVLIIEYWPRTVVLGIIFLFVILAFLLEYDIFPFRSVRAVNRQGVYYM
jgi:hypothetical protein